jgi:putative thioredoxin
VKLLLELRRVPQARMALDPIAGKAALDGRIAALELWLQACETAPSLRSADALRAAIAANRRDFDARYELAQGHFAAGRFTDAMDELLEIVMRDKQWNEQLARRTYVAILDLMSKPAPKAAPEAVKGTLEVAGKPAAAPGDPVVDQYRRKLSMALF